MYRSAVIQASAFAEEFVLDVERQPLEASVKRLAESLDFLGESLADEQRTRVKALADDLTIQRVVVELQKILDPLCLATVSINLKGE